MNGSGNIARAARWSEPPDRNDPGKKRHWLSDDVAIRRFPRASANESVLFAAAPFPGELIENAVRGFGENGGNQGAKEKPLC
jgi:hypothetical protein